MSTFDPWIRDNVLGGGRHEYPDHPRNVQMAEQQRQREYAAKEQQIAPEPIRDIQRQMADLSASLDTLAPALSALLSRIQPVLGHKGKPGPAEDHAPPACTGLGEQLQAMALRVTCMRYAVDDALERLQLP